MALGDLEARGQEQLNLLRGESKDNASRELSLAIHYQQIANFWVKEAIAQPTRPAR